MVSGTVMTYLFKKIQKGFSFLDFCTYSSTIWSNQPDIDKVYLHSKDPYEGKYQLLINKLESAGLNIVMILKVLLKTQMMQIIFMKILMNTNQIKNAKYCSYLI